MPSDDTNSSRALADDQPRDSQNTTDSAKTRVDDPLAGETTVAKRTPDSEQSAADPQPVNTDADPPDHPALPVPIDETDHTSQTDPEPDTPTHRTYVEIRPTDTALSPQAVTQAMEQLHATLERATQTRLRDRLRGEDTQPSAEWLLVADGDEDTTIRYLVGVTDESLTDELQRICRTAVPDTYELQPVQWHPRESTALVPTDPADPIAAEDEDASGPDQPPVAGVDYHARADRSLDWVTPFTSLPALLGDDHSEDTHRLPLTTLVETIRDTRPSTSPRGSRRHSAPSTARATASRAPSMSTTRPVAPARTVSRHSATGPTTRSPTTAPGTASGVASRAQA